MNIFVLDLDPAKAAQSHCDIHVVKMILESCQILSTVMHKHSEIGVYKPTHQHHPCVVWAGASKQNFLWLKSLMTHLCREYTERYGKHHKCESYLNRLVPPASLPNIRRTPFVLAMPEKNTGRQIRLSLIGSITLMRRLVLPSGVWVMLPHGCCENSGNLATLLFKEIEWM